VDPIVRPLRASDLDDADRIFRLAFGTFVGLPDPMQFAGDSDWIRSRFRTDPDAAFGAEIDGRLVGSNLVTTWGSVGFFGPLSVHPERWDAGVAKRLLGPTMDLFAARGTRHIGLFTFPQSAKHVGLYQRFRFWPRYLTAVMAKPVVADRPAPSWSTVSAGGEAGVTRALTNAVSTGSTSRGRS
jgi:predicted N-acetyltransferase YhbS